MLKPVMKKLWFSFAFFLITLAILSSVVRALTPWLSHYKSDIEKQLSNYVGQTIRIAEVKTGWYWFEPVIKLEQVQIGSVSTNPIFIRQFIIGIDLFKSVLNWQLQPGVLTIDGAALSLRQTQTAWKLENLESRPVTVKPLDEGASNQLAQWFLNQQTFILNNIDLQLHLLDGTLIPIADMNVKLFKQGDKHSVSGRIAIEQTTDSSIHFTGNFEALNGQVKRTSGQFYLSAQHLVLPQWFALFPSKSLRINSGLLNAEAWITLNQGQLTEFQTKLVLRRVALTNKKTQLGQMVQKLAFNTAWERKDQGWKLVTDNIKLRLQGKKQSNNQLLIEKSARGYLVYLKQLDLSIANTVFDFFSQKNTRFSFINDLKPQGILKDMRLTIENKRIKNALFSFKNLAWQAVEDFPGVTNVSGALFIDPTEGHSEISATESVITKSTEPGKAIRLKRMSGVFDWKKLSHGWRVIAERLVLQLPDLTLTGRFVWDDVMSESLGHLNLTGEFSGKELQRHMHFIPYQRLKKKLSAWLQRAIIKVGSASGDFKLKGRLADFPFDDERGQFQINAHLSDVDLSYLPNWPVGTGMDGQLVLNRRELEGQVHSGEIQGIDAAQLNFSIANIGLDKEMLYLHGQVKTLAETIKTFVNNTPLSKHLRLLNAIDFYGEVGLDLNLEIPLYPENTNDLAMGTLRFEDNDVLLKRWWNTRLNELTGQVEFNQQGILSSRLMAKLFDFPINIGIKTLAAPEKKTELRLAGTLPLDSVQRLMKLPISPLLSGTLNYQADIDVTEDESDYDTLSFNSNLYGVKINLPPPFDKSRTQKKSLSIKSQFALNREILVWLNYQDKLSAVMQLLPIAGNYALTKGEVRLGSAKPLMPSNKQLRVIGSLKHVDVETWQTVFKELDAFKGGVGSASVGTLLDYVDVYIKDVTLWGQSYRDLKLKVDKFNKAWRIMFDSKRLAGQGIVGWPKRLKLNVKRWHLDSFEMGANISDFEPEALPAIDLKVTDFRYNGVGLGQLKLLTKSTKDRLLLENLSLKGAYYDAKASGYWQAGKKAYSTLKGVINTTNLAKTLSQFGRNPLIEAKNGQLTFDVNWQDQIFNPSLQSLHGDAFLSLKKGQITQLDKETVEKIGLGKLLSILSLQTLPRRLVLDFSDLSNKGFSYDIFSGHFNLKKGVLSTRDSYMDGPVAYVSMRGDLSLSNQRVDLVLKVSPHITASLPIVATIAGGPVAGIATWVASKLINQGMRRVSAYTYKITGPWDKPVVQQVSITQYRS